MSTVMELKNNSQSDLAPDMGCELPGSIPDSTGATASFFNECLLLCKRELRSLSQSLLDAVVGSLRHEAHLIISDACTRVSKESFETHSSNWLISRRPCPMPLVIPPPPTVHMSDDLKNVADADYNFIRSQWISEENLRAHRIWNECLPPMMSVSQSMPPTPTAMDAEDMSAKGNRPRKRQSHQSRRACSIDAKISAKPPNLLQTTAGVTEYCPPTAEIENGASACPHKEWIMSCEGKEIPCRNSQGEKNESASDVQYEQSSMKTHVSDSPKEHGATTESPAISALFQEAPTNNRKRASDRPSSHKAWAAGVGGNEIGGNAIERRDSFNSCDDVIQNLRDTLNHLAHGEAGKPKNTRLSKLVRSDSFDYVFGLILVVNALAMGVQVDWEAMNLAKQEPLPFAILDAFFCLAFFIELGLRFYVFRIAFYFMPGWQWAYFDTIIVCMQAFEEVMKLQEMVQGNVDDTGADFRVLKLLKIGRLLRMVRMVRLIPELKSMVYLILSSISSFFWSCVLLCIMIYSIAIYLTMMATDVRQARSGEQSEDLIAVHQYWGSLGDSIMSLFWSITGGQDWADLIEPLVNETGSQLHNIVFAFYIAFATMVVMNLVTGVFVEGAQRLTKEEHDSNALKMAQKTFNVLDDDDDVQISNDELTRHMQDGKMDKYLETINLQRQDCLDLFELLDVDGNGKISLNEFTHGCLKLRGQARAADVAQILLDVRGVRNEVSERLQSLVDILDAKSGSPTSDLNVGVHTLVQHIT